MKERIRCLLTAGVMLSTLGSSQPAVAASCTQTVPLPTTYTSAINIQFQGTPTTSEAIGFYNAVGQWSQVCNTTIPDFVTDGSGSFTVTIVPHGGTSPASGICQGRCGCFDGSTKKIHTYGQSSSGANCYNVSTSLMEHELGHVLGLLDSYDSACAGTLMGPTLTSTLSVTSTECQAVDSIWVTPSETTVGDKDHPCTNEPA